MVINTKIILKLILRLPRLAYPNQKFTLALFYSSVQIITDIIVDYIIIL